MRFFGLDFGSLLEAVGVIQALAYPQLPSERLLSQLSPWYQWLQNWLPYMTLVIHQPRMRSSAGPDA